MNKTNQIILMMILCGLLAAFAMLGLHFNILNFTESFILFMFGMVPLIVVKGVASYKIEKGKQK